MTILQKLNELLNADLKRLDKIFEDNIERSQEWKDAFSKTLENELSKLELTDNSVHVRPNMQNVQELDQLQQSLNELLRNSGLEPYAEDLIRNVQKRLGMLDDVWDKLGLEKAKLGDMIEELPEISKTLQQIIRAVGDGSAEAQRAMSQTLLNYKNSIQTDNQESFLWLKDRLVSNSGVLPRYAGTIANTSLFALDRTVRKEQSAKAGLIYAKFFHPMDKITRPWCEIHGNETKTWDMWESLRNDTGPQPPSLYGGGYNCRGMLVGINPEWEKIDWEK